MKKPKDIFTVDEWMEGRSVEKCFKEAMADDYEKNVAKLHKAMKSLYKAIEILEKRVKTLEEFMCFGDSLISSEIVFTK